MDAVQQLPLLICWCCPCLQQVDVHSHASMRTIIAEVEKKNKFPHASWCKRQVLQVTSVLVHQVRPYKMKHLPAHAGTDCTASCPKFGSLTKLVLKLLSLINCRLASTLPTSNKMIKA